ncbi:MAG: hypothetical protein U5K54_05330 [Cytophagales bacterium]|nr:hypothetical protein [Cytophagales bacterium]
MKLLDVPTTLTYSFFQYSQAIEMRSSTMVIKNDMINSDQSYPVLITTPAKPGTYDFYLSINTGGHPPAINGDKVTFVVE